MKLSIIIVDYNSSSQIKACLNSILEFRPDFDFEIIIVDNASTENHLNDYEKISDTVSTFRLDKNLGFGGGNNFGAGRAKGEYLLLLNPDTLIIDDSIQKMCTFAQGHHEIGALTCLLYQEDEKTLQKNFFGAFQSLAGLTFRRYNYKKIDPKKEFFYTEIVTGAALMIRRSLFEEIEGFDEEFFMYLEDDDLCKRLADKGYKNAVLSTAKIIHLEGKSSTNKQKKKWYYNSQDYFWKKHYGVGPSMIMKIIRWPLKIIKTSK